MCVCAPSSKSRNATVQDLIIFKVKGHRQHNFQSVYCCVVRRLAYSGLRFCDTGLRNGRVPDACYCYEAVIALSNGSVVLYLFTTDSYSSNLTRVRGEKIF